MNRITKILKEKCIKQICLVEKLDKTQNMINYTFRIEGSPNLGIIEMKLQKYLLLM